MRRCCSCFGRKLRAFSPSSRKAAGTAASDTAAGWKNIPAIDCVVSIFAMGDPCPLSAKTGPRPAASSRQGALEGLPEACLRLRSGTSAASAPALLPGTPRSAFALQRPGVPSRSRAKPWPAACSAFLPPRQAPAFVPAGGGAARGGREPGRVEETGSRAWQAAAPEPGQVSPAADRPAAQTVLAMDLELELELELASELEPDLELELESRALRACCARS